MLKVQLHLLIMRKEVLVLKMVFAERNSGEIEPNKSKVLKSLNKTFLRGGIGNTTQKYRNR